MRKDTDRRGRRGAAWRTRGVLLTAMLALPGCGILGGSDPAVAVDPAAGLRIRREVEARLGAEPSIEAGRIRVEVTGRTVALHGSVRGFGALQCALANAGLAQGVDNVVDFLVLESGPRTVRCLAPRSARVASPQAGSPRAEPSPPL